LFVLSSPWLVNGLSIVGYFYALPVLAGIFEIAYIFYYLKAIEREQVGYLIPLFSLSPIFVLPFSVFLLGDSFGLVAVVGMILIILGVVLLTTARYGFADWRNWHKYPAARYTVISAILYGAHSLFLDLSIDHFSLLQSVLWSRLGVFVGALIIIVLVRSFNLSEFKNKGVFLFTISEVLYFVVIYLFALALAIGPVALVLGVLNIQPLFVFAISYLLWRFAPAVLKEEFGFKYNILALISVVIIVGGSVLMNF